MVLRSIAFWAFWNARSAMGVVLVCEPVSVEKNAMLSVGLLV